MLGSPAREILRSALGFIGMVLSVMSKAEFEQHLSPCLRALGAMPKTEKFHFKSRVRTIFSRLIRRYGFETISQLAADVDQKLVQHIRKVCREAGKCRRGVLICF